MPDRIDLLNSETSLCFDDILLTPCYSELESRSIPDISMELGHIKLDAPILSSPMDSITGAEMLIAMAQSGGLGILSRFFRIEDEVGYQLECIKPAIEQGYNVGCAIGIKNNPKEHAHRLLDAGCSIICLDAAHGDHKKMYEAINQLCSLKHNYHFSIMAGNVCTRAATTRFVDAGVDIIKVGIGPGAACTTRRVTGFGMPQLTAVLQCADEANGRSYIIADGGLRHTGDMMKALWAGADACMTGYMLAGTSATPDIDGNKSYRGMSSRSAHQRTDIAAEGIDIKVHYQGKTQRRLEEYTHGLQSGLAMAGARNIAELREAEFVKVSVFTMEESNPVV